MKTNKKELCTAQRAWKEARSLERWELRADRLMLVFSHVSVLLPSQIAHIKNSSTPSSNTEKR